MAFVNRHDFKEPILKAIKANGKSATLVQVCRYIWENHESELRAGGDVFYTWQYEVRHAASILRKDGLIKDTGTSPRGVWEIP